MFYARQRLYFYVLFNSIQEVGCDHILYSGKEKDRCGMCEGNGDSCTLVQSNYTKNYMTGKIRNRFSSSSSSSCAHTIIVHSFISYYFNQIVFLFFFQNGIPQTPSLIYL